jgi:hypothetical protein
MQSQQPTDTSGPPPPSGVSIAAHHFGYPKVTPLPRGLPLSQLIKLAAAQS